MILLHFQDLLKMKETNQSEIESRNLSPDTFSTCRRRRVLWSHWPAVCLISFWLSVNQNHIRNFTEPVCQNLVFHEAPSLVLQFLHISCTVCMLKICSQCVRTEGFRISVCIYTEFKEQWYILELLCDEQTDARSNERRLVCLSKNVWLVALKEFVCNKSQKAEWFKQRSSAISPERKVI